MIMYPQSSADAMDLSETDHVSLMHVANEEWPLFFEILPRRISASYLENPLSCNNRPYPMGRLPRQRLAYKFLTA